MNLVTGSTRTIAIGNLKDASGNSEPLPAGMVPTFTASPAGLITFGAQNPDGSQPFTVGATTGPVTFSAKLVYPDGDVIAIPDFPATIVAPEDVSGSIVIT